MSTDTSPPSLGLRMRSGLSFDIEEREDNAMIGCLHTLLRQGKAYRCGDYLRRSKTYNGEQRKRKDSLIDENCREKMVEWTYKVSDHFHIPREIVACAISCLDRFVEGCACDRTAFKLAAMTSLYIATKTLNGKQISINTLAELSRGEFSSAHIAEMELIMLDTLKWKLSPPTVQTFIRQMLVLMPTRRNFELIHDRAMFLAELSAFDYAFVPHDRHLIALGCVLVSAQAVLDDVLVDFCKMNTLEILRTEYDTSLDKDLLDNVQQRLLYLYARSTEIQYNDLSQINLTNNNFATGQPQKRHFDLVSSPVSVIQKSH